MTRRKQEALIPAAWRLMLGVLSLLCLVGGVLAADRLRWRCAAPASTSSPTPLPAESAPPPVDQKGLLEQGRREHRARLATRG